MPFFVFGRLFVQLGLYEEAEEVLISALNLDKQTEVRDLPISHGKTTR